MTYVFYLDRYHLGDPLFLNRFARDLQGLGSPAVVVHGGGEAAERALEADGRFPSWQGDVLAVSSRQEEEVVERAARDLNRQIALALNDAGVAAVRLDGASRGLFAAGEGGGVQLGETAWLAELTRQGAVPVVAALGPGGAAGLRQVSGGAVAGSLAAALEGGVAVFLIRGGGVASPTQEEAVAWSDVPHDALPEPEAVQAALRAEARVRLAMPRKVGAGGPVGVPIDT